MNLIKLLIWVKRRLFNVPDLHDKLAVQQWVTQFLEFCDRITEMIPGVLDDKSVVLLKAMIANDQTWDAFYDVLLEGLGSGEPGDSLPPSLPKTDAKAVALLPMLPEGFDWEQLLQIVRLLIELFRKT